MVIEIDDTRFEVTMYDTVAGRNLKKDLPQEISMSRWGDEFYGSLVRKVDCAGDALQDVFSVGEVALWPDGNALCIFFGPTPASRGTEPRMVSPGVALGKIEGDPSALRNFGATLRRVRISLR
jgi:hypothetical protein